MYENMLVSKILDTKNTSIIREQNLTLDMFLNSKDELEFIFEHKRKYGTTPDPATFLAHHPTYELYSNTESDEFIAYKIRDAYTYTKLFPILTKASEGLQGDSIPVVQSLKEELTTLSNLARIQVGRGTDIVSQSAARYDEVKLRSEIQGLLGITTGIPLLDDITFGWLKNDYVILFARTNQGKSWVSLLFGLNAWLDGKKVIYYSGEMDKITVGLRFDNLHMHFRNNELMNGEVDLTKYKAYIDELQEKEGFIVVDPEDFGGFPTVQDLEDMMTYHDADILIVDQLSLMRDRRKGKTKTERYTNISQDFVLSNKRMKKPIILVAQATRESEKSKKEEMDTPKLTDIEYADALSQDTSKVLSFVEVDSIIKVSIQKSRFGAKNRDVLLQWNKDEGYIRPLLQNVTNTVDEYGF